MKRTGISKNTFTSLGIALGALLFGFLITTSSANLYLKLKQPIPTPVSQLIEATAFSYEGSTGIDALTLLKQYARIEQDASGLVIAINGKKVDTAKREYWAFYVNNTLASVGPQAYVTKKGEKVVWKIETY